MDKALTTELLVTTETWKQRVQWKLESRDIWHTGTKGLIDIDVQRERERESLRVQMVWLLG
jgi:hypothetical protein